MTAMLALAAALALVPTPIGVGPRYHPPPAAHGACIEAFAKHIQHRVVFAQHLSRKMRDPARFGVVLPGQPTTGVIVPLRPSVCDSSRSR